MFTDENYVAKKLNHRVRANPPPPEINGDINLNEVNNEDIHNSNVQNILE